MMENRDSFVVTIFSSDSTHLYDNKLSKFTVEFDEPIDLRGAEWEVALRSIITGPITGPAQDVVGEENDAITLDRAKSAKYTSMQELTDMLVSRAVDPNIYTTEYFSQYLNPAIQWELAFLNQAFPSDRIKFSDGETPGVAISTELELKHFAETPEINKMQVPNHITTLDSYDKYKIPMVLPASKSPVTMRQVLNLMTRYFLSDFRGGGRNAFHDDYLKSFVDGRASNKDFVQILKEFEEHKAHGNKIVQELIKSFVTATQESRKKFGAIHPKENKSTYMFVYCDIVENSYVGSSKARILTVGATVPTNMPHGELQQILDFKRLEKKFMRTISIEIRSENGELVNFVGSRTPTMVGLTFRRVRNGGQN